ncbi:MAG: TetR/AcrR family transcriptional regulator [Phycicoccus sp.]
MRERILLVAGRLFAERGYGATSVRDIAEQLGISNPSLYHHFSSKAELLEELLREPLDLMQRAAETASHLDGPERFRVLVQGMLEALEVHSGVAVTMLDPRGRPTIESRKVLAEAAVPDIVSLLVDAGLDGDPESRHLRVTMAVSAVEGAVKDLMLGAADGAEFVERLRARRAEIIDAAMHLLAPFA